MAEEGANGPAGSRFLREISSDPGMNRLLELCNTIPGFRPVSSGDRRAGSFSIMIRYPGEGNFRHASAVLR